ncbi:hypothetical protein J3458_000592 [Metarhizium acridum]|uniref:uncharacterized protein n=1 Tax=Metarhizium acridum TaxID=92637 RepID=UPI001C6C096B|nr:hypothetical protein J3458_000592 [Metarhizium acridum]
MTGRGMSLFADGLAFVKLHNKAFVCSISSSYQVAHGSQRNVCSLHPNRVARPLANIALDRKAVAANHRKVRNLSAWSLFIQGSELRLVRFSMACRSVASLDFSTGQALVG